MKRIAALAIAIVVLSAIEASPSRAEALPTAVGTDRTVPWQFLSKLATEAYGEAPDQVAWAEDVAWFRANGCNAASLADRIRLYFRSARFTRTLYPVSTPQWAYARTIALYRAALNREVDQATLERVANSLYRRPSTWRRVVDEVVTGAEFVDTFTPMACGMDGNERWPNYGFAASNPTPVPPIDAGVTAFPGKAAGKTQADLQALLLDPAVTVVELAPQAVVELTSTLRIPSGKTLRTVGEPGPQRYALQARLVRVRNFGYAAVAICDFPENILYQRNVLPGGCDGASVRSVWIDGNRTGPNDSGGTVTFSLHDAGVYVLGGTNTSLEQSRISNTAGWTSVFVPGAGGGGWSCGNVRVVGNLVDSYTADHSWSVPGSSDGIGVTCHDVLVADNHVIDASDVPLIMFTASWLDNTGIHNVPQRSQFVRNTVFQAANGVVGGITFSGLTNDPSAGTSSINDFDFTGSLAASNLLWSSPTREAHFDFLFAVGNRMWNPTPGARSSISIVRPRDANRIRGASITDNTTGSQAAVAQFLAGAAGAMDTRYERNAVKQIKPDPVLMPDCGAATHYVATLDGGWASFTSTDVEWEDRSLLAPTGYGCALGSA